MLVKPSDLEPPSARLEGNLEQAILAYNSGVGKSAAKAMAQNAAKSKRFIKTARDELGRAATMFYRQLNQLLYIEKHALVADLRGDGAANTPEQVWNHAVFYYEARYKEVPHDDPSSFDNDHFMEIDLKIVANQDVHSPPSSSVPALSAPNNGVIVDGSAVANRLSRQILWISFDSHTGLVKDDARNEWKHSKGPHGDELYVPMYMGLLLPTGTTPANATPNHDPLVSLANGNDVVGLDLVTDPKPLLKIRARYKLK